MEWASGKFEEHGETEEEKAVDGEDDNGEENRVHAGRGR